MIDQWLSPHFQLSEFVYSQTATRLKIDNTPSPLIINNLQILVNLILEPLRNLLSRPIHISSGYRCPALNSAIGGASHSQHQFGQAADILVDGLTPMDVLNFIRGATNIASQVDQCIFEFGEWTHVSTVGTNQTDPRNQYLSATHTSSGTVYTPL